MLQSAQSPVKELRLNLGLTQNDLAELSRVSQAHISQTERGFVEPSANLINFLRSLHIDIDEFIKRHTDYMQNIRQKRMEKIKAFTLHN